MNVNTFSDGPITSSPSFHMSYSPPIEWTFADAFKAFKKTKRDIQQQFVWKPMEVNVQEDNMDFTGSTETAGTLSTQQELTTATKPEVTTPLTEFDNHIIPVECDDSDGHGN